MSFCNVGAPLSPIAPTAPIFSPFVRVRRSNLLLGLVLEGHDQVEFRPPWQMRNVNLPRGAVAAELCEVFIMRRDDHDVRAHVIGVIRTMRRAMQVRYPRAGE